MPTVPTTSQQRSPGFDPFQAFATLLRLGQKLIPNASMPSLQGLSGMLGPAAAFAAPMGMALGAVIPTIGGGQEATDEARRRRMVAELAMEYERRTGQPLGYQYALQSGVRGTPDALISGQATQPVNWGQLTGAFPEIPVGKGPYDYEFGGGGPGGRRLGRNEGANAPQWQAMRSLHDLIGSQQGDPNAYFQQFMGMGLPPSFGLFGAQNPMRMGMPPGYAPSMGMMR